MAIRSMKEHKYGMAQSVFISHSSLDKTTADAVCQFLEAQGIPCWIAPRNVPAGSKYGEVIIQALEEARAVVLLFSAQSNASEQVMNEVERAVSKKKALFPLKLSPIQPSGELEYFISRRHWLDCTQAPLETVLPQLAAALHDLTEANAPVVLRGAGASRASQLVMRLEATREGDRLKLSAYEHLADEAPAVRRYTYHEVAFQAVQTRAEQLMALLSQAARQPSLPSSTTWVAIHEHGATLYSQLLPADIREQLDSSQATELLLSLDDTLVQLPWELLYDGRTLLCRRFNIGRFVSTQQALADTPRRPQAETLSMLILANPQGDLEAAAREGHTLQRELAPDAARLQVTLQQGRVTTAAARAALGQYDVLHYAGHAIYDLQEPAQSGLLLVDGTLTASDVRCQGEAGPLPALVFCNTCESGQTTTWASQPGAEHAIYGLANAFLLAGTHHYIGTFWDIPDEPSSRFAMTFYRALAHGAPIGAALQEGRQHLRERYGPESVLWTSYMLYGDPTFVYLAPALPASPVAAPASTVVAAPQARAHRTPLLAGLGLAALLLVGLGLWWGGGSGLWPAGQRSQPATSQAPHQRAAPLAAALSLVTEAYQALEQGDLDKATALFQSLTAQEEAHVQAQGYAGLAALALARSDAAQVLERVTQAETRDPEAIYPAVLRGHLLWQEGNMAEAVAAYRTATTRTHGLPWQQAMAYNRLGRLQAAQGDLLQALESYDKALAQPHAAPLDLAVAYTNKGHALASLGKWPEAMGQYRQAQQMHPADRLAAVLLQEAERREKATQDRDRNARIDQLVSALLQAHKEGRPATAPGDGWTSMPLTLAFLHLHTQGAPAARAGEEEALMLRLLDAVQMTGRLIVLERDMLDKVLAELHLSAAELTDQQTAVRVGRILSARLLVTGTLTRRGPEVQLGLRVVETETTRLRAALTETLAAEQGLDALAEQFATALSQKLRAVYPLQGRLLQASTQEVLLNIGTEHGVTTGMSLQVLQDVPLQLDGKVAGVQQLAVGLIEVTRVEAQLAQARVLEHTLTFETGWKVKER